MERSPIIGASGKIEANGANGGAAFSNDALEGWSCGGGGSGGGVILALHGGTYTNNGTVEALGGLGGVGTGAQTNTTGGPGGAGSITVEQIDQI